MSPRVRIVLPSTPLARFVIASLAVHALCVVVIVAAPSFRPAPPRIPDSVVVDLVAAPAPAAATPMRAPAPPEPEVVPERTPQPRREPPPPSRRPAPDPDASRLAAERSAEPEAPPPVERPSSNPAPGEATDGPAVVEGGFADVAADNSQMSWYRGAVIASLYSSWRKPVVDGLRQPIEVSVTFEISADGRVRDLRVERESGIPSLDRSALRAVTDAAPFPPLPRSWRRPSLPAAFVFQLRPESR